MEDNKFEVENCAVTIRLNPKGAMKAQAQVDYGNLRIYGYRVMINKEDGEAYVLAPSVQSGNAYRSVVRLSPREEWDKLCGKIVDEYKKELNRLNTEDSQVSETIDPDEIPF